MPMTPACRAVTGALLALLLSGCATTGARTPGDPLERMNRTTHRFNDAVDRAVLKPVATAYRDHLPQWLRTGIDNVMTHLAFPTTIVNDLLQLKVKDTLIDLGRFTVNTTLGIGGILDPASHFGIPRNDEDFGQTLGRWGVPPGPYLVLPLLGPSTARDAPSIVADGYTDIRTRASLKDAEQWGIGALSIVNRRSELLAFDASFESAFDKYAFIRNAWLQRREYQVRDGEVEGIPQEELDDVDEELLEEAEALDRELEKESEAPPETPETPEADEPPPPPDETEPSQPPPEAAGASRSSTSQRPASADTAGGMFR
jgi:phospholipid-binding lipoprotein MlaA